MIVAKEISISGSVIGSTKSYNTSSILIGNLIKTYTDPSGSVYASPLEIQYERPYDTMMTRFDQSANLIREITVTKYSDDIDYIFYPQSTQIYGFRFIYGYKFTKSLNKYDPLGAISIFPRYTGFGPYPGQTLSIGKTFGFMYRYNSGSVTVINNVTSSLVSGSNTRWDFGRVNQGARIGFGTDDYTKVTNWYEIADVPTSDKLNIPYGVSYTSSVPYVIEELKMYTLARHISSASFNGLIVIHGLHEGTFSMGGTTIFNQYSSSLQDRQRGHYKVSDNPYSSSLVQSVGAPYTLAIEPEVISPTEHYGHVGSYNANPVIFQTYKFNLLYPAISSSFSASWSGSAVGGMMFPTDRWILGGGATDYTGDTIAIAKTGHGPGSGSYNLYRNYLSLNAGTSWRMYRTPLTPTRYYTASLSSIADTMWPVQPGSSAIRPNITGHRLQYIPSIDRFHMSFYGEGWYGRSCLFQYDPNFGKYSLKNILYAHNLVYNRFTTAVDERQPKMYMTNNADPTPFVVMGDDMMYSLAGAYNATPFGNHVLYAIPIGANYEDAPKTKQWVTFPPIDTSNAKTYRSIYLQHPRFIGADNLGFAPERLTIFYRTSGISDDSGTWIRLDDIGDLSDITVANQIQFSVSFDVLGMTGLFNRLYGLCLTYEDLEQDSHYLQSYQRSDIANNKIVWVQTKKWGKTIPNLKVQIYNAQNDELLLDDSTDVQSQGVFEYSTNGGSTYLLWNNNQDQIGNYVRYTANYLPANTRIRVVLNLK